MPAAAIEAVFVAEMGSEIVSFGGHSASQNCKRLMPARAGFSALVAAARQAVPARARPRNWRLTRRQPLEGRQAVGDVMESLLVDGEDRHLRTAEDAWIVKRAGFQNHGG